MTPRMSKATVVETVVCLNHYPRVGSVAVSSIINEGRNEVSYPNSAGVPYTTRGHVVLYLKTLT